MSHIPDLPQIPGVPDRLILSINERLRMIPGAAKSASTTVIKSSPGTTVVQDTVNVTRRGATVSGASLKTSDFKGERLSVTMFGAKGDGTTNDAPAFAAAIGAAAAAGGGEVYIPRGSYLLSAPVSLPTSMSNVRLAGDGAASIVLRGADLPAGQGLFDVRGSNIQFRSFVVDGRVMTPTGLLYGAFPADPMTEALSRNTSFWVHGGARRILFDGVTVRHTGGYSILLDATAGDISDVWILECLFENNRPHLFGTDPGDLNYGSWTGGVHYQGDGSNYAVSNLLVEGCTFLRNTGNCCWGHLYAFAKIHSNIRRKGNYFQDCGLDGILMGGEVGGCVEGNQFRRTGYICTDDSSPAVPRWLQGAWACAIDSAGLVRGVNVTGNTIVSANGGSMDLDGYSQGVVSGNTCIIPSAGEPEYVEDRIAEIGPGGTGNNWTYGVNSGNTNNIPIPGTGITVTGNTFINQGGGAIRLFCARNSVIQGNNIIHPAGANYPPIGLGNTSAGDYQRARGNVVVENKIAYDPAAEAPAIIEDASYANFEATDKNWVSGNRLTGNCFEFQKHASSGSSTHVVMSTAANGLTSKSENILQRESSGDAAVYRNYRVTAGGSAAFTSLFDVLSNGAAAVGGPLFNVSNNGAAGSGSVSTGARTTAAWDDAMLAGKLYGDALLCLGDATYAAAEANLMPDTYGLLRYDSTAKKFLLSSEAAEGARVWKPLVAVPDWVQFVEGEAPDPHTLWVDGFVQPTVGLYTTSEATNAIQAPAGGVLAKYVASTHHAVLALNAGSVMVGMNTELIDTAVDPTARLQVTGYGYSTVGWATGSVEVDAIQAPSGGMLAKWLIGTTSLTLVGTTEAAAGVADPGRGRIYFDTALGKFRVSENGGAYVNLLGGPWQQSGSDIYYIGGNVGIGTTGPIHKLDILGSLRVNIGNGGGQFVVISDSNDNSVYLEAFNSDYSNSASAFFITGAFGGIVPVLRVYAATSYFSGNVGILTNNPIVPLDVNGAVQGHSLTLTGSGSVLSAGGGAFGVDSSGNCSMAGVCAANGGFNTSNVATDALQAASGGVTAKWLIGTTSLTLVGTTEAAAGVADPGRGRIYFDTALGKFRVSESGGAYVNLLGGVWQQSGSDIYYSAGRVGIGTDNPQQPLHLKTADNYPVALFSGTTGDLEIWPYYDWGGNLYGVWMRSMNSAHTVYLPLTLTGSNVLLMPSGAVGINTTSPSALLDVNGAMCGHSLTLTGSGSVLSAGGGAFGVDSSGNCSMAGVCAANGGFNTSNVATDALQAASGGVTAKWLIGTVSLSLTGTTEATAGPTTAGNGRIYFDTAAGKFKVSENGGAYQTLVAAAAGVSSLNTLTGAVTLQGTLNHVTITPSGNTLIFSLPQSIHTGAAVQFYSLLTSDAIQSNRVTGPAIYAPNAYIQGKGFVSSGLSAYNSIQSDAGISAGAGANGGFWVGATQVVNSSGQFVGNGISMTAAGCGATGFNCYSGGWYNGVGSASFTSADGKTVQVKGGIIWSVA